ncbi:MAG: zinc-dependent metalloprotease [Bacteroidota bacterium]
MKHVIVWVLGLFISGAGFAQSVCGFDALHEYHLKSDPDYAKRMRINDQSIKDYILKHPELMIAGRTNETVYTIPVVVHVLHTGDTVGSIYNPSDDRIINAINYMNDLYSGNYSWVGGLNGAKDIGIRFVLAKRDPNCNPTNGIVRVNAATQITNYVDNGMPTSNSTLESQIKSVSRWDPTRYYNIWVVNKINGADGTSGQFIAGFAYFPGSNSNLDGTVALATSIREDNKILTHELGHAFNLYHPFQGSSNSSQCPSNGDCLSEGDRVCDTDPISYNVTNGSVNFSCRTGNNPCIGVPYSENTESNFMGYTSCFTLFTLGQKARMRASMLMPSRSSLASSTGSIPPDQNPACPPKINFTSSSTIVAENKEVVMGCSGYKDYTYSLSIVSGSSANATVTLSPTGTATAGVDYQIFTNGNTTAPSNIITFPAGVSGTQNFMVRVMDDADLESAENITLNYTVSGGNALKGEAIPTMNITIRDNDSLPLAPNAVSAFETGVYNATLGQQGTPFRGSKLKHRVQYLFSAAELLAAGIKPGQQIRGVSLFVTSKISNTAFTGFSVSVGQTTFALSNFRNVTPVFSGDLNTVAGENRIDFTTPFTWNGTSNLVVQFCYENTNTTSNDVIQAQNNALGTGAPASCFADLTTETTSGCGLPAIATSTARAVIKFFATVPGNMVASNTSSNSEAWLGPNADVYFFNASGQIISRIKNLSAFDYGCTTVQVDRSGSATSSFWSNDPLYGLSQKTFKVTPKNPNPNGNYEISLYYNNAEKSGYETSTGLAWATVQMVKSEGSISGITPSSQQPTTVTVNNNATKSGYGSDHIVTATFTNGFSGFAVGSPGVATSVSNLSLLKGVHVYPNPVQKQVNLQFDQSHRDVSLRLLTVDGRVLQIENINGSMKNHILNIEQIQPGYYLLEVMTSEGRKTLPIIKQ